MVLELRDHDDVARAEVVGSPGVRDEVDRLGRAAREDDLARRRRVQEAAHLLARALVALGRPLGEPVDAAVHVRVAVLVEVAHRVEHLAWLLGRGGRVEVGDGLAVDEILEIREVGADALDVELRLGSYRHEVMVLAACSAAGVDLAVALRAAGDVALALDRDGCAGEDLGQQMHALRAPR